LHFVTIVLASSSGSFLGSPALFVAAPPRASGHRRCLFLGSVAIAPRICRAPPFVSSRHHARICCRLFRLGHRRRRSIRRHHSKNLSGVDLLGVVFLLTPKIHRALTSAGRRHSCRSDQDSSIGSGLVGSNCLQWLRLSRLHLSPVARLNFGFGSLVGFDPLVARLGLASTSAHVSASTQLLFGCE
jgi:hypothetical protein